MRSSTFSSKKISIMFGIAVVLAVGVGFALFNKENKAGAVTAEAQPVRPVKVMALSGSSEKEVRTFTGVVRSVREVALAFRVGGPLEKLDAAIG